MIKKYEAPRLGRIIEVDVDDAAIEAKEKRQQARDRANKIEDYRNDCFFDKTLRRCTFKTDDQAQPELTATAHNFVDVFLQHGGDCTGLLLYGAVGRGKTFMSACIANAIIDNCYSCYMTTFSRISNELQATWSKQEYINRLMRFDLLIIDDLAAERDTEYMNEVVFDVIDERNRSGKPIIITTNLTGPEMANPADMNKARIYSRLFEMCDPVEVVGKDRRKAMLRDRVQRGRDSDRPTAPDG